ncbi:MAG: hypothetical protein JNM25_17395, partial [Planctomycetes bacterium]|nr:hypothetical protein [Planctomycetota bacterium]
MGHKKRIALISTGGTIEKTYDELEGVLDNRASVLDVVLASLQLHGVEIVRVPASIERVLRALGLPTVAPALAAARSPPVQA